MHIYMHNYALCSLMMKGQTPKRQAVLRLRVYLFIFSTAVRPADSGFVPLSAANREYISNSVKGVQDKSTWAIVSQNE